MLVVSKAKSVGLGCVFFRPASLFVGFNDTALRPPLALPNEKIRYPNPTNLALLTTSDCAPLGLWGLMEGNC